MKFLNKILLSSLLFGPLILTSCSLGGNRGEIGGNGNDNNINNNDNVSEKFTVNFFVDGNIVDTQTIKDGGYLNSPSIPWKDGYTFLGWYFGNHKRDFLTEQVHRNMDLEARLIKNEEANPNPDPDIPLEPDKPEVNNPKQIHVLVQTADHGWTGAVRQHALEKVEKLRKERTDYEFYFTSCDDPMTESYKINDILVDKENLAGIVLLPIDSTLESSMNKIVDSGVPFSQFDRIISTDKVENAKNRVSNVIGDNYGIGYATAEDFIKKGIKKTDKVLLMPGDWSSVPVARTNGFKDALAKQPGWSKEEVESMITETQPTGWNRYTSRKIIANMGDRLTQYDWIFTHDDEIALGILEELNGNNLTAEVKDHFKNGGVKCIAGSSGLDEMYAVMENNHTGNFNNEYDYKKIIDVTYDPANIVYAIDDMMNFLDGKDVQKEHVIPSEVVDYTNVKNYKGFGTGDYRK